MRRTIFDHTPDGLRQRLADMERQIADLQRVRNPPATYVEPAGGGGAAQLLVLSAAGASIAAGGGYAEFDQVVAQHGFGGVAQPAGGQWVHPIDAVYTLTYEHAWDSHTGTGHVRLELDGILLPEGDFGSGSGSNGRGTLPYYATAGSIGRIYIDHDSAGAETYDGTVRIAVSDATNNGERGTQTIVGWYSTGWRYLVLGRTDSTDYSAASLDDSSWSVGQGAFGATTGGVTPAYTINTHVDVDQRLWIRRTIVGSLRDVQVSIRVDDTGEAWWNGTYLGSFTETVGVDDETTFDVPAAALDGTTVHVLAVRLSDNATGEPADEFILDAQVTGTVL